MESFRIVLTAFAVIICELIVAAFGGYFIAEAVKISAKYPFSGMILMFTTILVATFGIAIIVGKATKVGMPQKTSYATFSAMFVSILIPLLIRVG